MYIAAAVVLVGIALVGSFAVGSLLGSSEDPVETPATQVAAIPAPSQPNPTAVPATDEDGTDSPTPVQPDPTPVPATDDEPAPARAPVRVVEMVTDNGSGPVSMKVTTLPADELPDEPKEVSGVFVSREDNSVIVGTGAIELRVEVNQTEGGSLQTDVSLSANGPEVEVVVTHDTILYREETEDPAAGRNAKGGEYTVQQVLTPVDNLEELGKNTEVLVWGYRRGDRVVADILVYRIVKAGF
jgi:hypothetical protein